MTNVLVDLQKLNIKITLPRIGIGLFGRLQRGLRYHTSQLRIIIRNKGLGLSKKLDILVPHEIKSMYSGRAFATFSFEFGYPLATSKEVLCNDQGAMVTYGKSLSCRVPHSQREASTNFDLSSLLLELVSKMMAHTHIV